MWKTRRLRPRPAGSPEAPFSARSCLRLPRASASLGQSAAWAALAGHIGHVFHIGVYPGGRGDNGTGAGALAMKSKGVRCSSTSASGESSAHTQSVTSPQSITGQRHAWPGSGLGAWRRLAAGLAAGAAAAGAAALGGRLLAGDARVRFLGADGARSGVGALACARAGEVRRAFGADGARAGEAPRALAGDLRARCFDGAEG